MMFVGEEGAPWDQNARMVLKVRESISSTQAYLPGKSSRKRHFCSSTARWLGLNNNGGVDWVSESSRLRRRVELKDCAKVTH